MSPALRAHFEQMPHVGKVVHPESARSSSLRCAQTLAGIVAALAARPESGLAVCVNHDGLTRNLDADEQRELEARLDALR